MNWRIVLNLIRSEGNRLEDIKKIMNETDIDMDKYHFLENALSKRKLDHCVYFLKRGANPNVLDYSGVPLIFSAVFAENTSRIGYLKLFLKHGADPNTLHPENKTPVLFYVIRFSPSCVPLFIRHGADCTVRNKKGKSALHWSMTGYWKITLTLLAGGARPEPPTPKYMAKLAYYNSYPFHYKDQLNRTKLNIFLYGVPYLRAIEALLKEEDTSIYRGDNELTHFVQYGLSLTDTIQFTLMIAKKRKKLFN